MTDKPSKPKTVFVVGAGASLCYGYPLGAGLVENLINTHFESFSHLVPRVQDAIEFGQLLRQSACDSIDVFLESQPGWLDLGRLLITEEIVRRENPALVLPSQPSQAKDNWYRYLFNQLLPDGSTFDHVWTLNTSFVTFNYDRSLEFFLVQALRNRFGKAEEQAFTMIANQLPIAHVYGDLGPLPWEKREGVASREYGKRWETFELQEAASKQIHIFAGGHPQTAGLDKARRWLHEAERIYFLGFGYHPANIERLNVPWGTPGVEIFGTGIGVTNSRKNALQSKYTGLQIGHPTYGICEFLENCEPFLRDVSNQKGRDEAG
ncbi:MAG TPA: hypothetical protein VGP76_20840 [Planctomycetaceae bacterium]|jgi:hypothetical protein|nr:hypothetical protein [Planctomycetaceae bacterium]